jgi:hypothetical protein
MANSSKKRSETAPKRRVVKTYFRDCILIP